RRIRMGTICEIRAWCRTSSDADRIFAAGFAEIERVEQVFSAYRQDSELSLVNNESANHAVQVSDEFFDLTEYAIEASKRSLGAFDITVGPLIVAWGMRSGVGRIPNSYELREALRLVGSEHLRLDRKRKTIQFLRRGMNLDFGGLAKGYAAE